MPKPHAVPAARRPGRAAGGQWGVGADGLYRRGHPVDPLAIIGATLVVLVLLLVAAAAVYDSGSRRQQIVLASTGDQDTSRLIRLRRRANQYLRTTRRGLSLDQRLAGASVALGPADFILLVAGGTLLVGLICQPLLGYLGAAVIMFGTAFLADRWLAGCWATPPAPVWRCATGSKW